MAPRTGTLLIARDIGAAWGQPQAQELAGKLESRLKQPVVLGWAEDSFADLTESIQSLVNADVQRVVVIPLGLLPIQMGGPIPLMLARVSQQWPSLSFHIAAPLTWLEWTGWLQRSAIDLLVASNLSSESAAILLVGSGSANLLENADVARIAQLLRDTSSFAAVHHAFVEEARPLIKDAICQFAGESPQTVVIVPWLQCAVSGVGQRHEAIETVARANYVDVRVASPQLGHAAIVNLLVSNHLSAQADQPVQFSRQPAVTGGSLEPSAFSTSTAISPEEAFELQQIQRRINSLLPSEYKNRFDDVSPKSMGSAGLKFDSEGKVAWGEIWTSFCDLALAGGPPHRGTLLEAVTAADAMAEREQYDAVVAEIERGIRLVTALPIVTSPVAGWVGVRCESEEMAVWLMRAIIVENIMVRREGDVLYLPAGPRFTLKREIKNVITSIAKTTHYWKAHLLTRQQSNDANS